MALPLCHKARFRKDLNLHLLTKGKLVALPFKLLNQMVAGARIELASLAKETNVLPLHYPAIYKIGEL